MKLEVAGLANQGKTPYFQQIFGTNVVLGCKNSTDVWQRALAQLPVNPEQIATIGDNQNEDGVIPQGCGIGHSFILRRDAETPRRREDNFTFVNDAKIILAECI